MSTRIYNDLQYVDSQLVPSKPKHIRLKTVGGWHLYSVIKVDYSNINDVHLLVRKITDVAGGKAIKKSTPLKSLTLTGHLS